MNLEKEASEFFKLFGDVTRLQILRVLLSGEKNVNEIASILNRSQSAISHQLKIFRLSNIVRTRKEGKTVYYSLSDDHIKIILEYGWEHIKERIPHEKDR